MVADEGYHLNDPAVEDGDSWTTALALSKAIEKMASRTFSSSAVKPPIGTTASSAAWSRSSWTPSVTVEWRDGKIGASRVVSDGFESVITATPCVLTISNEFGDPRYPQLRQIMQAAKKDVTVWTPADLGLDPHAVGAAGARVKMEQLFVPKNETQVEFIDGDSPAEKAQALARKLREAKIV